MKKYVNGEYIELTQEELDQLKKEQRKHEVQEKHRQLTPDEVNQMLIKAQVNTLDVDDKIALRMLEYYPTFEEVVGQSVKLGFKFTYQGELYKVIQSSLLMQAHYYPQTGTESLYTRIDEEHDGDIYDPIPYKGNMALENGKYYVQDGVIYKCTNNTINAVYNDLKDLVKIFVEVVENI